jgi:hypothetical protein
MRSEWGGKKLLGIIPPLLYNNHFKNRGDVYG